MDPLRQYGSHAFIKYWDTSPKAISQTELRPPNPSSPPGSAEPSTSLTSPAPLSVNNNSTWTYCGPLLPPSPQSLPPSFYTWSASTINGPFLDRLIPFLGFLHTFLSQANVQHYWLTIRVTKPTTEFDTARWHADDIFFDTKSERGRTISTPAPTSLWKSKPKEPRTGYWKLATTLLGPSTLFLKDNTSARKIQKAAKKTVCTKRGPHTCTTFKCLGCFDAIECVRQLLATQLANAEIESTAYGEAAFFRLGDDEGAIHSEPRCNEDRIFVNVVPGSEEELTELMGRWGMEYPRDWSFGVPVRFEGAGGVLSPSLRTVGRGVDMREEGESVEKNEGGKQGKLGTMSLNLRDEYVGWLAGKGFLFDRVFG